MEHTQHVVLRVRTGTGGGVSIHGVAFSGVGDGELVRKK